MKRFVASIIFLLVLGFMTRSMGPLTEELASLTALFLFLLFLFIYRPQIAEKGVLKTFSLSIGFIIVSILITRIPDEIGRLVGIAVVVTFLELAHRLLRSETRDLPIFALTSLLYGFALFIYSYVPEVWWVSQELCTNISGLLVAVWHKGFVLGPTAFGFFILCSFSMLYLSAFLFSQRRKITTLVILFLYLLGAEIIFLMTYPFIYSLIMHFWPQFPSGIIYLQFVLFLLLLTPTFFYFRDIKFRKIPVSMPKASLTRLIIGILVLLISSGLLTVSLPIGGKGNITFYEQGIMDWRVPTFDSYGQRNVGMFGLLPKYLEAKGYRTSKVSTVTDDSLAQSDVLVMINLNKALSDSEKESIWEYVRNGGSVLVMGDHTNVEGLMDNFNALLDPVPIKFRFDSASSSRYGWRDSLAFFPHPISSRLEDETDVQHWIGASLDCQPPSSPIIIGRYAFSDIGDPSNDQRAFLGNMILDPGEQLGDVVLAAESRYGKGKVLVFGDTTSFQNGSLFTANEFVDAVFRWLLSKDLLGGQIWHRLLATVGFVFAVFLLTRPKWNLTTLLICATVLAISTVVPRIAQGGQIEEDINAEVAYIDYSHIGRFDLMAWEEDSIGGLTNNMLRNGFIPLLLRDFSSEKLSQTKLLVLIAPSKPFQTGEIDEIKKFVEQGGILIISVGWEEGEAAAPLLESIGLYLDNVPLGPVKLKKGDYEVAFKEAWPVLYTDGNTNVVIQQWGYPIVVVQERGKGRIITIGDSYFLLNENLEGVNNYSLGNIFLLRDLLRGGDGS